MFMFYSEICFLVSEMLNCPEHNRDQQQAKYLTGIFNELVRIFSTIVRLTLKKVDSAFLTAAFLPSPSHVTKVSKEREVELKVRSTNDRYRARMRICQSQWHPFCHNLTLQARETSQRLWIAKAVPSMSIHRFLHPSIRTSYPPPPTS